MKKIGFKIFKIKYTSGELLLQRIFFSLLVIKVCTSTTIFSGQPYPNGLANYIDFTFLANPYISIIFKILLFIFSIVYICGRLMPISVGYLLFYVVALGTLRNSQGAINHGTQIVALILLGQFCAYCWYRYLELRKQPLNFKNNLSDHDFAVYFSQQAIAAVYVVAGSIKLINSGIVFKMGLPIPGWIIHLPMIAVEIIKTHSQEYYNTLSAETLERGSTIANWIISHPNLSRIIFSGGLFLELFAFLILLNRRWSFLMGISLILMHLGIFEIMQLKFEYNIYVLLIYTVNVPFLILSVNKLRKHNWTYKIVGQSRDRI